MKGIAFIVGAFALIAASLFRYAPSLAVASNQVYNVESKGDDDDGDDLGIFRRNAMGHNNLAVFTVASHSYLSILMEWLNAPAFPESNFAVAPINVTVVCTDSALKKDLFRLTGRDCYLHNGKESVSSTSSSSGGDLFVRWTIIEKLNNAGFDVLYSDADAFWLKDPFPTTLEAAQIKPPGSSVMPPSTLVSSRGAYPFALSNMWGATVCTGFVYIRGRLPVQFWTNLKSRWPGNGNDQDSINEALREGNLDFGKRLSYKGPEADVTDVGSAFDGQLAVVLLPHRTYPRMCRSSYLDLNATIVLHCISVTGDSSSKRSPHSTANMEYMKEAKKGLSITITAGKGKNTGFVIPGFPASRGKTTYVEGKRPLSAPKKVHRIKLPPPIIR